MSMRILIGSLLAAMTVASTNVSAGEFVDIGSGTEAEPVRLIGYLARPQGAGPFSAVVLLHGCGGFHSSMISWADRLSRYGYAALAIDSFGPRGMDDHCGGFFFHEQAADGYAALSYLTAKSFVRAVACRAHGFFDGRRVGSGGSGEGAHGTALRGEVPRRHRLLSRLSVRLGDHDGSGARPGRRQG